MTKTLLIVFTSTLLFGCNGGNFQKADSNGQIGKEDTVAIYWVPMQYDTLKASIKEHFTFPGDDTLDYLPADRDLTLEFEFIGKMKEYMEHGKMIVRSVDSSIFVQRINNYSFKLRANEPIGDWKISMYYELVFTEPYFFSYIFEGKTRSAEPNDTTLLFIRSRMIKSGTPAGHY